MAELNLKISAEYVWLKEDGDCSECTICHEMIFGNKYSFGFKLNIKDSVDIVCTPLCESCADALKEN